MHPQHFRESVIIHLKNTFGVEKIHARQTARMFSTFIRGEQADGVVTEAVAERLVLMLGAENISRRNGAKGCV